MWNVWISLLTPFNIFHIELHQHFSDNHLDFIDRKEPAYIHDD